MLTWPSRRHLLKAGTAALFAPAIVSRTALGFKLGRRPPISSISYGTPFKYSSQYPTKYLYGDVPSPTWAADGNEYFCTDDTSFAQDPGGPDTRRNLIFNKTDGFTSAMSITTVNHMDDFGGSSQTDPSDNADWKAFGNLSLNGTFYTSVCRQVNSDPILQPHFGGQIIKSTNIGASFSPLPPSVAAPYASPMFPDGRACTLNFVQYGQDYQGQTHDRSNEFVYFGLPDSSFNNTDNYRSGRCLITDMPTLDGSLYQYYKGGDGLNDANWDSNIANAVSVLNRPGKISSTGIQYLPYWDAYLMIQWYWQPSGGGLDYSITNWDAFWSLHPWGGWNFISTFKWDAALTAWYSAVVSPKSIASDGGLSGVIFTAGNWTIGSGVPTTDPYTPTLVPFTLT